VYFCLSLSLFVSVFPPLQAGYIKERFSEFKGWKDKETDEITV